MSMGKHDKDSAFLPLGQREKLADCLHLTLVQECSSLPAQMPGSGVRCFSCARKWTLLTTCDAANDLSI